MSPRWKPGRVIERDPFVTLPLLLVPSYITTCTRDRDNFDDGSVNEEWSIRLEFIGRTVFILSCMVLPKSPPPSFCCRRCCFLIIIVAVVLLFQLLLLPCLLPIPWFTKYPLTDSMLQFLWLPSSPGSAPTSPRSVLLFLLSSG